MKTRALIFAGLSSVLLWTVTAAAAPVQPSPSSPAAQVPAQHLTQKQAQLVNSASKPEDHRALAQYFRQEVQRKREKEQSYLETSATYRLHPLRVDMYRNVSTADSYKRWADEARAAALFYDQTTSKDKAIPREQQ